MPRRITPGLIALIVVLTLMWGTNWTMMPLAVREVSVWTFRAASLPVSAALLLLIAALRGERLLPPRGDWPVLAAAAFFYLAIWHVTTTYAAILIPSGQAAVLGFTMPVWTALFAFAFLGHRFDARSSAALLMAAIAVALLAARGWQAYAQAPLGFALGIVAGMGWAIGTLILKVRPPASSPLVSTAWQLLLAWIPIASVALWRGIETTLPSAASIAVIAYIALVPMALGNVIWFSLVRALPAQVAGLSAVMSPVIAMASGHLVLGEPLGPLELAAMVLASGSVLVALWPRGR